MILEKHKDNLSVNLRFPSMELALRWFDEHGGKVAVETGCQREENDWGGGCSTLVFGEYFKAHPDKEFYSVDISENSLDLAKRVTEGLPVNFTKDDSIHYLSTFPKRIDFLYLDSLDCNADPIAENRDAQRHQLLELQSAWDKLTEKCVVLLDDCGFSNGGKGRLTRQYLREQGWKELWDGYQSLWVR